jgi:hypothetical protein
LPSGAIICATKASRPPRPAPPRAPCPSAAPPAPSAANPAPGPPSSRLPLGEAGRVRGAAHPPSTTAWLRKRRCVALAPRAAALMAAAGDCCAERGNSATPSWLAATCSRRRHVSPQRDTEGVPRRGSGGQSAHQLHRLLPVHRAAACGRLAQHARAAGGGGGGGGGSFSGFRGHIDEDDRAAARHRTKAGDGGMQ